MRTRKVPGTEGHTSVQALMGTSMPEGVRGARAGVKKTVPGCYELSAVFPFKGIVL